MHMMFGYGANGCTFKLDKVFAFDAAPTIVAPAACFGGSPVVINLASLVTVLPVGPVQYYTINGSNQISTTYTITAPGTYTFSVTDEWLCFKCSKLYTVDQLIAGAVLVKDLTLSAISRVNRCNNPGGTGPFSYQMFNAAVGGITPVTGNTFTANNGSGTYSFTITDVQTLLVR
jgi:hypothetical protein